MATVRFSKELVERILEQAKAKFEPAIIKAHGSQPDNSWGQRIYDVLFHEVKPFIMQAPAGWLNTAKQITIAAVGDLYCGVTFTFSTPQPWPCTFIETELARLYKVYSDSIVLKNHLVWGEFYAEVAAYQQRIREAETRCNEFVRDVHRICSAYSTLAPALKAWPPLWELLPEDVKDRHNEETTRPVGKKKVVLEVDFDKLTALSTAAKFGL